VTFCADEDCGREFTPTRSDAAYCSGACRQRAYRVRKARAAITPERRRAILADLEAMTETFSALRVNSRNAEETITSP